MMITIVATIMIMAAYFLLLYAEVGFIQKKRFASTAHKDILAVIPEEKERFRGAHIIGWCIAAIALLLFIGAFTLGVWDGVRKNFGFLQFFARFLTMLYVMEVYDIVFFDWALLCHSNFFPHYYPELANIVGPHMFGYNKRSHIIHFIVYIPVCAVAAWGCTLLC